ncbi:39S ribosomal protein L13, mitochondrial [Lingula anatina]|uniref:39S ribosomal protein L13, mitochondrial n=1 Tax=Lingula anatina TaxID=7574 RepID=A0A1S3IYF8_LINAN|nr:39S ribosomal protein L13, mitochondrial [Lingula anatina]|eukprot:XP_013403021.1 39S ribosomal protein L13, mitochondrial [Lingula anatina]
MIQSPNQRVLQWATFARIWWLYDAHMQCPFKSSNKIAHYLQGKHKPVYHPLSQIGDHVVVINSRHIALRDDLWRTFIFSSHTGYRRGFTQRRAWVVHEEDPTEIIRKSVYSRLPGNLLRKGHMARLHIYPDENVPPDILKNVTDQLYPILSIPKRLDQYTEEEVRNFPKLFDWPEDHKLHPGKPVERRGKKPVKASEENT